MAARRITISCPRCREQFKDVPVDEAERILFHGCAACRSAGRRGPGGPKTRPGAGSEGQRANATGS